MNNVSVSRDVFDFTALQKMHDGLSLFGEVK
jgi:hypothetical protein